MYLPPLLPYALYQLHSAYAVVCIAHLTCRSKLAVLVKALSSCHIPGNGADRPPVLRGLSERYQQIDRLSLINTVTKERTRDTRQPHSTNSSSTIPTPAAQSPDPKHLDPWHQGKVAAAQSKKRQPKQSPNLSSCPWRSPYWSESPYY